MTTGTTSVLSIAPDGQTAGNGRSYEPVFSADSHHVGFVSYSDNLVSGVTFSVPSGQENVFERNLITGTTQLVSMSMNGQSDGNSFASDRIGVSADGQYVAFSDSSTNLTPQSVAGDDNHGVSEVYVRDTVDGTTTMVSVVMNGTAGGNTASALDTGAQVISADGRYVVFDSGATDLTATPPDGDDAYLRDLQTGTTTMLSASAVTGQAVRASNSEVISPDGRFAAFATTSTDVVSLPTARDGCVRV